MYVVDAGNSSKANLKIDTVRNEAEVLVMSKSRLETKTSGKEIYNDSIVSTDLLNATPLITSNNL